ncbi:MAG: metallophosphoesterase [Eubacteriales bacterium]
MQMRIKHIKTEHRRVIVISDIHGNLPFFQGLLDSVGFCKKDILILLGDILEKGQHSLKLLRYIWKLERDYAVYSICGNCDALVRQFFASPRLDELFFRQYLAEHPESTLCQLAMELNCPIDDLHHLRTQLRTHYQDVYQWIDRLPISIRSETMVFIHGGVPSLKNLPRSHPWSCMKNDYFYQKNHSFSKYMVVGHCPVTLYREDIPSATPIIDHERKIISIDGGCVLKLDGQLNALLIENGTFSTASYDGLPKIKALTSQAPSQNPLNIRWGRSKIEVISKGEEFSTCLHHETGQQMEILSKFIYQKGADTLCEDSTNYHLPVEVGDLLSVSEIVTGGVLAKKDGVTGWFFGEYTTI